MPPYRAHLHLRIAREIPDVRLWTVVTHEEDGRWALQVPDEIGPVRFGEGVSCLEQGRPSVALREWRKGGRIIRWLKRHGVRGVVMAGYNDPARLRVLWWCHGHRIPCFISGDSNIADDRGSGPRAALKRVLLGGIVRRAAGVLPFGSRGQAYFARYGASADRTFLFPLEPDEALVRDLPADTVERVRSRLGLPAGRRRLLYSGRLVPYKRVDHLIGAFVAIAGDRPEWDLVILGDGPQRAELSRLVPPALASRVYWLGHSRDQAEVSAVYRSCDVLVLPSEYEPWALVIQEAVAAGMAVVSSSVPGAAAELVRDGINGRIYPVGDVAALSDCLRDVTDAHRTPAMKAAGARVLADWHARADPVRGLRQALRSVGVIDSTAGDDPVPL